MVGPSYGRRHDGDVGMNVLIHPYAARLPSNTLNPKNFPHWAEVVRGLNLAGYDVIQVGLQGEERIVGVGEFVAGWSLKKLRPLVEDACTFAAVDSFFPHFVHVECGQKPGVVIWGQSDPALWGHPENINLLRDRKFLRPFQFASWTETHFAPEVFVPADEVVQAVVKLAPRTIVGRLAFA